jgi:hypothetical protein
MEQLKNKKAAERPPMAFQRDFSITTNIFNKDHNAVQQKDWEEMKGYGIYLFIFLCLYITI